MRLLWWAYRLVLWFDRRRTQCDHEDAEIDGLTWCVRCGLDRASRKA